MVTILDRDNNPGHLAKNFKRSISFWEMPSKWTQAGKLGPEEQKERNEGDLRRDAGGQESVQPKLQQRTEEREEHPEEQDEEQKEEKALLLPQFMEQQKTTKYVTTFRNKALGH